MVTVRQQVHEIVVASAEHRQIEVSGMGIRSLIDALAEAVAAAGSVAEKTICKDPEFADWQVERVEVGTGRGGKRFVVLHTDHGDLHLFRNDYFSYKLKHYAGGTR